MTWSTRSQAWYRTKHIEVTHSGKCPKPRKLTPELHIIHDTPRKSSMPTVTPSSSLQNGAMTDDEYKRPGLAQNLAPRLNVIMPTPFSSPEKAHHSTAVPSGVISIDPQLLHVTRERPW